mgnify:CR=1 FL=1
MIRDELECHPRAAAQPAHLARAKEEDPSLTLPPDGLRLEDVEKDLVLDREKVNVNGGAIGLGHPLGATGTRLIHTLLIELGKRGKKYGIASACIGGGQGMAVLVERA